jgi:MSHA type pilus biogenesis protein MshL
MRPTVCMTLALFAALCVSACTPPPARVQGERHLDISQSPDESRLRLGIPELVVPPHTISAPSTPKTQLYSVTVKDMPVRELLFTLGRDARRNMDVHPGLEGTVTLNAVKQSLPQLLTRIARQTDMRWEQEGDVLSVMPDRPLLRTYNIDYVNMAQDLSLVTAVNPHVGSGTVDSAGSGSLQTGTVSGNSGLIRIEGASKNRFWDHLEKNVRDLLRETDRILPAGSSETTFEYPSAAPVYPRTVTGPAGKSKPAKNPRSTREGAGDDPPLWREQESAVVRHATFREAASVIVHPETGVLSVRATARQHDKVRDYLDQVMSAARRQVLIEATIAEVQLSHGYQQGIDWQALASGGAGFTLTQSAPNLLASQGTGTATTLANLRQTPTGTLPSQSAATGNTTGSLFVLAYRSANFAAAIKLLESFGDVRVLSSPKLSVLNNQTALLNAGSQLVYFKVNANTTTTSTGVSQTTVDTTPQTASVGLLLSVTPQIGQDGTVLLNVRPSISRVTRFRQDPNPQIPSGIQNLVPEIERRELSSVLRIPDGETVVLGGLMQDTADRRDDSIPGLSALPVLGQLFSYKNHASSKSELVVFLRPTVLRLDGDETALRIEQNLLGQLADNPDQPAVRFALGNARGQRGAWGAAVLAYEGALRLDARCPDTLFNMAVSLERLHKPQQAIEYYARALQASQNRTPRFDLVEAATRLSQLREYYAPP